MNNSSMKAPNTARANSVASPKEAKSWFNSKHATDTESATSIALKKDSKTQARKEAMQTRRGEAAKTYFRTDRFYTIGPQWFAATREGNNIGPFQSRESARQAVAKYLTGVKERKDSAVFASTLAKDCWSNTNYR